MTKRQKRLLKLRQNPRDVSFDELRLALEAEGFVLDHVTGSHYIFRAVMGVEVLTVVIPFGRPVKPVYVRKAVEAIDRLLLLGGLAQHEEETESDDPHS